MMHWNRASEQITIGLLNSGLIIIKARIPLMRDANGQSKLAALGFANFAFPVPGGIIRCTSEGRSRINFEIQNRG